MMSSPDCKICNAATRSLKDNKTGKIYHVCDACEFMFLDQLFILPTAEEKRRYEFHNNTFDNSGYVEMFERFIANVITPNCGEIRTALDFGCGTTPVLAALLKNESTSVDHFDPYFYPEESYKGRRYDLITATEVIEHLQEPLATLRTLIGLLNPGRYLALMTQLHPCNDKLFLEWWYRLDDTHISFYSVKTLAVIAGQLNVTISYTDNSQYCLFRKIREF